MADAEFAPPKTENARFRFAPARQKIAFRFGVSARFKLAFHGVLPEISAVRRREYDPLPRFAVRDTRDKIR